jgi:hypothetical protein
MVSARQTDTTIARSNTPKGAEPHGSGRQGPVARPSPGLARWWHSASMSTEARFAPRRRPGGGSRGSTRRTVRASRSSLHGDFCPAKAPRSSSGKGLWWLAAAVILWSGTQGHGRRTPRTRSASFDSWCSTRRPEIPKADSHSTRGITAKGESLTHRALRPSRTSSKSGQTT